MIWLISIFLVAIASYLIMQGLAERKLIQESDTDSDKVDADLFMSISKRLNPEPLDGDLPIADEGSAFATAVRSFQEKSEKASERMEKKIVDYIDTPKETLYDRVLAKVTTVSAKADEKLEQKITATKQNTSGASIAEDNSQVGRIVSKVSTTLKKAEDKLQERIDRTAHDKAEKLTDESGLFANAVSSVGARLETFDQRVDDKLAAYRVGHGEETPLSSNNGFFSRVASKVGEQVNYFDDKIIVATRKLTDDSQQR